MTLMASLVRRCGVLLIPFALSGAGHGQTTNVWSGATSASLTVASNYNEPRSVNSDGNDSATFVFGRVATTRSTLSASSEFKANRFEFESTADKSFDLSAGFFNFVKSNNGIFQGASQAQRLSSGIKISDGPLTLGGNGAGLVTLAGTSSNDYGGKGLTKTGSSAFFIDAPSIGSTGNVAINGGVLALRSGTTLAGGQIRLRGGVLAASGTFSRSLGTGNTNVNFGAGGGGFAAYGNPLTVSTGLGTWSSSNAVPNGAPLILGAGISNNVVTLSGTLNLGTSGNTREIRLVDNAASANDRAVMSGVISGSAGLRVTGTGILSLTGSNTFSGGTTIEGGEVRVSANANLGTGTITLGGGRLAATESFTLASSRQLVISASSALDVAATKTLTFDGDVSGAGLLDKTGAGTLALGGASALYTGNLTVSAGELKLTAASVLQNATIRQTGGTVAFDAGGTAENPVSVILPDLSGSGGEVTLPASVVAVLLYEGAADVQTYEGRIRGAGGIQKHGTGRLTLTNDNDFTGTAQVTQGSLVVAPGGAIGGPATVSAAATLLVNGTARGTLEILSGGVLGGDGTISGLATIRGIHSPGNSPGLQTFESGVTYAAGSTFEWDLIANTIEGRGTNYDGANVTGGQLTIDPAATSLLRFNLAGSTVDWNDSFWSADRQWLVFDNASLPSGAFGAPGFTVDGSGNSLSSIRPDASFAWQQQGNDVLLVYAVPEPTTLGLAACAAVAGITLASVRRQRAAARRPRPPVRR